LGEQVRDGSVERGVSEIGDDLGERGQDETTLVEAGVGKG